MRAMHFATILEGISDRLGDREALVHGALRRSWRDYEQRAARLAGAFAEAGLGPGAKVGLYLYNGPEYLEVGLAALKQRMVPVNVNYRYVDAELEYLLENSDCEALVFDGALAETVARVAPRMPRLRLCLQVGEAAFSARGASGYEEALAAASPAPRIERQPDDLFMMYTGGTTGMPKGVMYDIGDFTAGVGNMLPLVLYARPPVATDEAAVAYACKLDEEGKTPVFLPCSPLMHTAGLFQAMAAQLLGGRVVTLPERGFDPHAIWRTVSEEDVTAMVLVGDAFARPLLDALEKTRGSERSYDLSALRHIISSGVSWSSEVKQGLLEFGDFVLIDGIGATEGAMGVQITQRGVASETARFLRLADTKVFSEDGREIEAGSAEVGLIAAGGMLIPKGYYKDPEKSARTFREIDGKRYAFIGDWGRIEADGTLVFLGRGSGCINTAGEKVFPEEVETFLKTHPEVEDCLVVGVPDERFGERVAAVVAARRPGRDLEPELLAYGTDRLAGYKRPRLIAQVARIPRAPN